MRKYIGAFKMFTGRSSFLVTAWSMLASAAAFAVMLVLRSLDINEAVNGFCEGFIPMFGLMVPVIGYIPCNALFTYNRPETPGYKFFHSLPEAAAQFRRAIIATSIFSLAIVLLWSGVLCAVDQSTAVFTLFIGLILKGAQNVFGHAKSMIAMFIPMMAVVFSAGFFVGFTGLDDETFVLTPRDTLIVSLGGVLIFVIGTMYSVVVAEKKWRRENS